MEGDEKIPFYLSGPVWYGVKSHDNNSNNLREADRNAKRIYLLVWQKHILLEEHEAGRLNNIIIDEQYRNELIERVWQSNEDKSEEDFEWFGERLVRALQSANVADWAKYRGEVLKYPPPAAKIRKTLAEEVANPYTSDSDEETPSAPTQMPPVMVSPKMPAPSETDRPLVDVPATGQPNRVAAPAQPKLIQRPPPAPTPGAFPAPENLASLPSSSLVATPIPAPAQQARTLRSSSRPPEHLPPPPPPPPPSRSKGKSKVIVSSSPPALNQQSQYPSHPSQVNQPRYAAAIAPPSPTAQAVPSIPPLTPSQKSPWGMSSLGHHQQAHQVQHSVKQQPQTLASAFSPVPSHASSPPAPRQHGIRSSAAAQPVANPSRSGTAEDDDGFSSNVAAMFARLDMAKKERDAKALQKLRGGPMWDDEE